MKKFRTKYRIINKIIIILFVILLIGLFFNLKKVSLFIGYQFYTVLTDSMEPTIPTYSLVLSKSISEETALEPNTIVTFHADRFGEDILLTHYFRKTQEKDGVTYYRTQPEGKDIKDEKTYDNYETTRDDIVGTYVFHIPYVGKIILFLKSPFGFIMYGELIIIYLLNKLIKTKWKEKENVTYVESEVPTPLEHKEEVSEEESADE